MASVNNTYKKSGTCESCSDSVDVPIWLGHHDIWMCAKCREIETTITAQVAEVETIIEKSKRIDQTIELRQDLNQAASVLITELHGAIVADESIPEDNKQYAYTKMLEQKVEHYQRVVFAKHEEYVEAQNFLRSFQMAGQTAAGKLREDARAQFKNFDVNYVPTKIKSSKTIKAAAGTPTKKPSKAKGFKRELCAAAAIKFGVPAAQLQAIYVSHVEYTYDDAGLHLAKLLGLVE